MSTKALRRLLRDWWREVDRIDALRRRLVYDETLAEQRAKHFCRTGALLPLVLPPWPSPSPLLDGMTCGAKAHSTGEPCKSTQLYRNGRCKFHGGASTGPKTEAGRARALENLRLGGAKTNDTPS